MFCEACGSRLEEGSVLCLTCGVEVRERPRGPRVAVQPAPELELQGPRCTAHPGMPLAGSCPRCGKPVCIRCAPEAARDIFTCTECYGLTAAHQRAPADASCAAHPQTNAAFICSRCGSFSCSSCAATGYGSEGLCFRCGVSTGVKASRSSRFVANLLDNFVVLMPMLLMVGLIVAFGDMKGSAKDLVVIGAFLAFIGGCVAQVLAQAQWGQSIGKRALGIKVVRTNGQPIELWRVLVLRNIVVHAIAQLCGLIGLVDALLIFGDDQRCLHDYLADSIVIEAPK